MKRTLFLLAVFCLVSCTKWEEIELIDGKRTLEVMNVEITFDFNEQQIGVLNKNHGGAEVRISRRVNDCRFDYTEIFYSWVGGRQSVCERAYFDHGDKIEMRIKIDNWTDEDPVRYSYFKLSKSSSISDPVSVLSPPDTTIVL